MRHWARLVHVESADPLRRVLNRALAPIYVLFALLALLVAPIYTGWQQAFVLACVFACLLGLYLNRRDVRGPLVLTVCCSLGLAVLVPSDVYFRPPHTALSLPGELLVPIIVAALFISPRAGLITCVATLGLITAAGLIAGNSVESIMYFHAVGSSTLIAVTGLLVVGADKFTQALRRSYEANNELERRVAERTAALRASNAELAAAKARIEQTAALRVKEVSEVVHDARNQLGHIQAATDLLVLTQTAERDATRLQRTIGAAIWAQQGLLDALLEATLLDAGALTLHCEPASVADLVEIVTGQSRPRYEQRGCALVVEPAEVLPAVACDTRRMLRVLQNVLNNALNYTASYRPTSGGLVRITIAREGDEAVIRVIDNGIGIAAEQLPLIGQRFVRGARGENAPDGTGLGLSASMGIVALHGGSLRLSSDGIGCGTTAEVRLPLE